MEKVLCGVERKIFSHTLIQFRHVQVPTHRQNMDRTEHFYFYKQFKQCKVMTDDAVYFSLLSKSKSIVLKPLTIEICLR